MHIQVHQTHNHLDKDMMVVADITIPTFTFMVVVAVVPQKLVKMLQQQDPLQLDQVLALVVMDIL